MKNNIKKNFIWNLIGVTCNSFTSLFFLVIVNRINGKTLGGLFSYSFSLVCLFYIVALYYNRVYQVSNVNDEFSNNQYITNRFITSFISIIIILIFSLLSKFKIYKIILILLLMIYKSLEAIADCFHAFIQKKEQLYYVGKSLFYKAIIGVILFILLDILTHNLLISILSLIIVNIIGLLVDIKRYLKLYMCNIKLEFKDFFKLLKESLSLFIFSFLIIFINNCQKYVSVYFMNNQLQNILGIIIMPATMLTLCGQYLISPYLTTLTNLFNEKKIDKFEKLILKINIIFIILGLLIFVISYLLGIPVLNIIYSINLTKYKNLFLLIIIGAIFYSISTIISNCLTVIKKNNEQLIIFIFSSVFSCVISIILIKNLFIKGAIYAYFITMFVHFILSFIMLKYFINKLKKEA